jgi:SAM-dependent methyltransferase
VRLGHRKVPTNILEGKRVLDIGCGRNKYPGSVGLDHAPLPGVDVVASLEKRLPFEDAEFDAVLANQVLEHVQDMVGLMAEIHRVLKPGGQLLAHVPYFRSSWAHSDPTHVRGFCIITMDNFVEGTFSFEGWRFHETGFSKIEVFIDNDYPSTLARRVLTPLALRYPFRYENSMLSNLYPFEQLSYLLTK